MTEYQVQTTHVPPVLRLIDGVLHVEVIFGAETYRAPIGDGRYFFSEVIAKLVDPALLAVYPRQSFFEEEPPLVGDGAAFRAFISPND